MVCVCILPAVSGDKKKLAMENCSRGGGCSVYQSILKYKQRMHVNSMIKSCLYLRTYWHLIMPLEYHIVRYTMGGLSCVRVFCISNNNIIDITLYGI